MSTITSLFQQAQLAEAAYANFFDNDGNLITDDAGVTTALTDSKFSPAQAAEFVTHWKVVDHLPDTIYGFSATIFERIENGVGTGQYQLAIRGSTGPADFTADANLIFASGIASLQLVDLYNFWTRATTPNLDTYTTAVFNPLTNSTKGVSFEYFLEPPCHVAHALN